MYIRPPAGEIEEISTREKYNISRQKGSTVVGARKRNRETSPSTRQFCQRAVRNAVTEVRMDGSNGNIASTNRPDAFSSTNSRENNLAIDLVDSSDDDDNDVEIIEVL